MSRFSSTVSLAAMLAFCLNTVAASAPVMVDTSTLNNIVPKDELVQKVHRCHSNNRYNYVEEIDDEALHRHRGNSCRVQIIEERRRPRRIEHCHSGGQRHRHRGFGRTTHSHFQRSCEVDEWRQHRGGGSTRGCIKVGPVTFCP